MQLSKLREHFRRTVELNQHSNLDVHPRARMEASNIYAGDHYPVPLPSIENLAYNDGQQRQGGESEQVIVTSQYAYDLARNGSYSYRIPTEHNVQYSGQHSHHEQIDPNPQHGLCSPAFYQTPHGWQGYDGVSIIPGLGGLTPSSSVARGLRHKRSRMSLQKRLLVNARERERMRVLNKAFEGLRDALPCYIADGHMAKITTLRLAINYIKALTEVLNEQKALDEKQKENKEKEKQETQDTSVISVKVEGSGEVKRSKIEQDLIEKP